jgi:hypothetical protein
VNVRQFRPLPISPCSTSATGASAWLLPGGSIHSCASGASSDEPGGPVEKDAVNDVEDVDAPMDVDAPVDPRHVADDATRRARPSRCAML